MTYQHRARTPPGKRQIDDVRRAMRSGKWLTLAEIEAATGHPQAAISARIRDLRKRTGYDMERRLRHKGEHEYRMTCPAAPWEVGGRMQGLCVLCCAELEPTRDERPWYDTKCRACKAQP